MKRGRVLRVDLCKALELRCAGVFFGVAGRGAEDLFWRLMRVLP